MGPFPPRDLAGELLRCSLLVLVAFWATSPFLAPSLIGGGDAIWYHHQVADAVTQFRDGVFPVFTGQTSYSFNGAIHPFRTAPYCQYLAGLIDWVTGHRLGFHALLHFTAMASLLGGALTAYGSLVWIAPAHRWRAVFLALVYVLAPGVLGLPFAQDLYMSTMAVPWVPLALAAAVQLYRTEGYTAPLLLGGSLGALWWAHSPIAVWTTLAAGVTVTAGLYGAWRRASPKSSSGASAETPKLRQIGAEARRLIAAGASLALVAAYPVVSVLSLRSAGERIVPRLLDRQNLLDEVHRAFPQLLLPLDGQHPLLTFMQPGYAVLAVLVAAVLVSFFLPAARRLLVFALVACAALYLVMILPVPGITSWIWHHVPELVANMTSIWPMQRLAIIVAALAVVALQTSLEEPWKASRVERPLVQIAWAAALAWTIFQADVVRSLAHHRTQSVADTRKMDLEENVNLSEYAYQQLPRRPAYFIHGVTDPRMEVRLLDPATGLVVQDNKTAAERASAASWLELTLTKTANPSLFELSPVLTLEPGIRYLATFEFSNPGLRGLLRFLGPGMQRAYVLPSAGDAKGFGTAPGQEKSLTLWTSRTDAPETVHLDYIREQDGTVASVPESLGRIRLTPLDPTTLPVSVTSLLPLRMNVRAPGPGSSLLETFRVYIPGWSAKINGKETAVQRSPEGLLAVEVPAGESEVEVIYKGPLLLRFTFWLSLVFSLFLILMAARHLIKCRIPVEV